MAQEYHNLIDLVATIKDRQRFIADAILASEKWGWDWVQVNVNDQASKGDYSDRSRIDFFSRGYPRGLAELMTRHPAVILDCTLMDLSAEHVYKLKLQNGEILEESTELLEFLDADEHMESRVKEVFSEMIVDLPEPKQRVALNHLDKLMDRIGIWRWNEQAKNEKPNDE